MNDRVKYRAKFEEMGVDAVRLALLERRMIGFKADTAQGWLAEKDAESAAGKDDRDHALNQRGIIASEKQASSAAEANRLAKLALALSAVAIIVSIVALVRS